MSHKALVPTTLSSNLVKPFAINRCYLFPLTPHLPQVDGKALKLVGVCNLFFCPSSEQPWPRTGGLHCPQFSASWNWTEELRCLGFNDFVSLCDFYLHLSEELVRGFGWELERGDIFPDSPCPARGTSGPLTLPQTCLHFGTAAVIAIYYPSSGQEPQFIPLCLPNTLYLASWPSPQQILLMDKWV